MIVLDSTQILTSAKLALETHVLPELSDDFARVQVMSVLKALDEVTHRLHNGDPAERSNSMIETNIRQLADSIRSSSPNFATGLDKVLNTQPEGSAARDRSRQLGEDLWKLYSENEGEKADQLLAILQAEALRTMSEDNIWICPEAILSLT